METGVLFGLSLGVGVFLVLLAVLLAWLPEQRKLEAGDNLNDLKRFHDERAYDVFKLFVQVVLAFGAGLGFLSVNQSRALPGMLETAQWIVCGSGYLLALVIMIHKAAKVWASSSGYWVSVLAHELFIVPGMVALTTVIAFKLVPAVFAR